MPRIYFVIFSAFFSIFTMASATISTAASSLSPADEQALRSTALDISASLEQRIPAVRRLAGWPEGELIKRVICIWDIVGRSGPIFTAAQDHRSEILSYGVDIELIPYTSETVLVEALKAGRCDAGLMTGIRARLFQRYPGTIDAVGALPSEEHMSLLLKVLAHPQSADNLTSERYVTLGIVPAGAAYIFVNDRRINSLAKAAGKKVAVLDYDPMQAEMVANIGATPISSNLISAPNKFNNGVVDVLAAPLVAYEVMELYKGMGANGGIIDYPLAQITIQLVGRRDKFPPEVAQLVREIFFGNLDYIRSRLKQETGNVPEKWWLSLPEADKPGYQTLMQSIRIELREKGYYDGKMLTLQRKIRCKLAPAQAECNNPLE